MSEATDVVVYEAQDDLSLVRGPNPVEAKEYAAACSKVIVGDLKPGNGYVAIQGKKHITVEGWQYIAAMTGHSIEIEWTRLMDDGQSWEARAVVRDQKGRVVAAGESMASKDERAPWTRNAYSIRSMAQTRAQSRAAQSRLRYIATLSGFSGTPAEEMPGDEPAAAPVERTKPQTPYEEILAVGRADGLSKEQVRKILKEKGLHRPADLNDDAVFAVAMDAVSGFIGGEVEVKGGMPVADVDAEVVEGEIVEDEEAKKRAEQEAEFDADAAYAEAKKAKKTAGRSK